MNAITTSSSGPPTPVSPTLQAKQPDLKSAPRPAPPFIALLEALGATDVVSADVGGAASTSAADVATSGESGRVATPSSPSTPDGAPAVGRRRHDDNMPMPVFAFGVPVTIAAIPVAGLTAGNVNGLINVNIARPQSPAVSSVATLPSPGDSPVAQTASPTEQGNSAPADVSAATLAVSTPVGDKPISGEFIVASPSSVATALAATPKTAAASTSTPVTTNQQSGPVQFTSSISSDMAALSKGTTVTPSTTAIAPQNTSTAGVTATTNGVTAPSQEAAPGTPPKSARHSMLESVPLNSWTVNSGQISGTTSLNVTSTTVSPPAHPAIASAAQQMAATATLLRHGQSAEMQLRLRPPDLGDVRVILRRDTNGALSAHLIPATREAGDVLNANLHHLRDALDQHSQGQRSAVSVGQHSVADQRQHTNGGHSSHEDETSAPGPATTPSKSNQPDAQRISRAVAAHVTIDYDA